jgi:hypothetical protein
LKEEVSFKFGVEDSTGDGNDRIGEQVNGR